MDASSDAQATYYRDPDTGHLMMPGSKRPDGTWRKPRRIKEGYVPQEEVPLYESKGKQWAKSKECNPNPPGLALSAELANMKIDFFDSRSLQPAYHIPGLNPDANPPVEVPKSKKKKSKNTSSNQSNNHNQPDSVAQAVNVTPDAGASSVLQTDPTKKLRNLKKKLRDIEVLEKRLESNDLPNPEPEQLEKVKRKAAVMEEIAALEKQLLT